MTQSLVCCLDEEKFSLVEKTDVANVLVKALILAEDRAGMAERLLEKASPWKIVSLWNL